MRTIDEMDDADDVLMRIDINSPVEDGAVQDNNRFDAHAETVRELAADGRSVTLLAHQGRPGRDTYVPLEQHAEILAEHLGRAVRYVPETVGEEARSAIDNLGAGEVLLLENVRFRDEELENLSPEEHARSDLVQGLKDSFDCYINDAYSAAHRSHASLVGFPPVMDAYAGRVMEREFTANTRIRNGMDGETVMLVGGKKVSDVVDVMTQLVDKVDTFLTTGLVGELFLRAEGYDVGYDVNPEDSFMHEQWLSNRDQIAALLADHRDTIELPRDLAYHNGDRMREEVLIEEAAKADPYWDVGKRTVEAYRPIIMAADAVFVKGAPGVFEDATFRYGTEQLLDAIGESRAFSVVGGGDTSRAVRTCGLEPDRFDHLSVAGGAYIRALTGETLPAIDALQQAAGDG